MPVRLICAKSGEVDAVAELDHAGSIDANHKAHEMVLHLNVMIILNG